MTLDMLGESPLTLPPALRRHEFRPPGLHPRRAFRLEVSKDRAAPRSMKSVVQREPARSFPPLRALGSQCSPSDSVQRKTRGAAASLGSASSK